MDCPHLGTWPRPRTRVRVHGEHLLLEYGDQLWLRHVVKPGEHQWARGANVLAGRGKQGTRTQVEHMRRKLLGSAESSPACPAGGTGPWEWGGRPATAGTLLTQTFGVCGGG